MTTPTARIQVFKVGTFTPMGGKPLTFSAAELKSMADVYDPVHAPAPIVVGHPATDAPAYGWADRFEFDAAEQALYADVSQLDASFSEAVKAGRYKKLSMAFHPPGASNNPIPGTWYPKHIGFLGGAAPAVPGLKNVHFAEGDEAVVFTAAFGTGAEVAGLFRSLRDWMIEKFGLEDADRALTSYRIDWLSDADDPPGPRFSEEDAEPPAEPLADKNVPTTPEHEEKIVSKPEDQAAFASREAAIAAREAAIAEREDQARHAEHVAFAEQLVADGKLIPASKDNLVTLLDAVGGAEAKVSFAEGQDLDLAEAVRALLQAQPKVVAFGEVDVSAADIPPVTFAADGAEVANIDDLARAKAYQAAHPGTSFLDAAKAIS